MSDGRSCIAIVGAGPKGLYCLERLAIELPRMAGDPPVIRVFEPHPAPGSGPVYDPSQPHYLRLNFANEMIDAWSRDDSGALAIRRPTFLEYLDANHPEIADPAGYAPRALVGEYLTSAFAAVTASLKQLTTVEVHPEEVHSISPSGDRFEVATATAVVMCDEVLVATGHLSRRSEGASAGSGRSLGPYPIDRPGGVADIPAGRTVAVRGLGLTAIDVALALTEGRGGTFEQTDTRPGRLRYCPTRHSPRLILPFSRTGRPMVPKDHPQFGPRSPDFEQIRSDGSMRISMLTGDPAETLGAFERVLVETAHDATVAVTGHPMDRRRIDAHLDDLLTRRPLPVENVAAELARGVDVAYGHRSPGPDWALGVAWKLLYPAIVDLFGGRRLDPVWGRFGRLAAEMERVAFGPPAENAARLLALVDAGVVDLSMATGATLTTRGGRSVLASDQIVPVDDVVDAVLAPPGVAPDPSPLVASLLESGLATSMPHAPGLHILPDGTCVGRSGSPTVGLSAVGRPTEGCVLGNDTLSRTLHDTPDRWARAAVRRLAAKSNPVYQ